MVGETKERMFCYPSPQFYYFSEKVSKLCLSFMIFNTRKMSPTNRIVVWDKWDKQGIMPQSQWGSVPSSPIVLDSK